MVNRIFSATFFLFALGASATDVLAQDFDKALSLFNQKQYRPAIREFHAVLNAHPDYFQSWWYVGASHFQLQGYEDAIDAMQNYLKGAEKDEKGQAGGLYYIGLSHYQLKQYDKAISSLARHIALSEKLQQKPDPVVRAALGRSYIFTERYGEAIPALSAAASEMKTNSNNYYYIGFAQQKLGKTDLAIAALNQGLVIDPKDADALSLLGDIYLAQSRQSQSAVKQAMVVGERLIAVEDSERAWSLLGQAYLLDKQYAKAAPLLNKYARAHPDLSGAWYNLGVALSRSNQWKLAAEALEQAVKLVPTNLAALLELGYVYESDKQIDKALGAYERAYQASGRRDETARAGIERVKQAKQ